MFTEAQILIAPNVNSIAISIDDIQKTPTKEELNIIIQALKKYRESL
jgi:hypothetical protein